MLPSWVLPKCMDQISHHVIVTGTSMLVTMGQIHSGTVDCSSADALTIYIVFNFQAMKVSEWSNVGAAAFICSHLPVRTNVMIKKSKVPVHSFFFFFFSAKFCIWEGRAPCINICWKLTVQKAALQKRTLGSSWISLSWTWLSNMSLQGGKISN